VKRCSTTTKTIHPSLTTFGSVMKLFFSVSDEVVFPLSNMGNRKS